MDKISIIIPVYNVALYLRRCLDSVISQSYTNLEILLINDGSTDNSGKICEEYANKDNRIKVFHKKNGGVSSAKNLGLEHITGKYIGFVDSDDWLEPDMYESLYEAVKTHNIPISVCNYFKDSDSGVISMFNRKNIPNGVISEKKMLVYPLQRDDYMGFCGYLWNKLFLADIFTKNKLFFESGINYGEDVLMYTKAILSGQCCGVYTEKPLYHYFQRNDSIAHSKNVKIKTDILSAYKKIEELFVSYGYSDVSYWARGFYCYHASIVAEIAESTGNAEALKKMQAEIESHLADYIATNKEFPEKFERIYKIIGGRPV